MLTPDYQERPSSEDLEEAEGEEDVAPNEQAEEQYGSPYNYPQRIQNTPRTPKESPKMTKKQQPQRTKWSHLGLALFDILKK
jgi:hypothetical protein